jgi:hypothetical protein
MQKTSTDLLSKQLKTKNISEECLEQLKKDLDVVKKEAMDIVLMGDMNDENSAHLKNVINSLEKVVTLLGKSKKLYTEIAQEQDKNKPNDIYQMTLERLTFLQTHTQGFTNILSEIVNQRKYTIYDPSNKSR